MGLSAVGTFHKRQGDQTLLKKQGDFPAGWGRLFGTGFDEDWSASIGTLDYDIRPGFDGKIGGFQVGVDVIGDPDDQDGQHRAGFFYAHTWATGDTEGDVLNQRGLVTGSLDMNANSLGGYWTYLDDLGRYVDAVAMYSWIDGDSSSRRGIGMDASGGAWLLSLEGGYPMLMNNGWTIEPQAQLIWQQIDLDDQDDGYARVDYSRFDAWTARIGLRAETDTNVGDTPVQPFVSADMWHTFGSDYTVRFNDLPVDVGLDQNLLEVSGGISAQISASFSGYGSLSLLTSADGRDNSGYAANLGFRWEW